MRRRSDKTTRPTQPIARIQVDRPNAPRRGDDLRVVQQLGESADPVSLDELVRRFPDRAQTIADVVEQLEVDGLVEVTERAGNRVVALTTDGRRLLKHL